MNRKCPWCGEEQIMEEYPASVIFSSRVRWPTDKVFVPACKKTCTTGSLFVYIGAKDEEEAWRIWNG